MIHCMPTGSTAWSICEPRCRHSCPGQNRRSQNHNSNHRYILHVRRRWWHPPHSQGLIYGYKYNEMLFYQDIITIRCYKNNKVRHHILSLLPHIIFCILFGQIKGMMYLCKWYSASRHNCSSEFGKSSSRFALSLHIETNIYRKWLNRQITICPASAGMAVW